MTIDEVETWFGNLHKACVALNIASQNSTSWKKKGYIPWKLQFRLAWMTDCKLVPDQVDPCQGKNSKIKSRKTHATTERQTD